MLTTVILFFPRVNQHHDELILKSIDVMFSGFSWRNWENIFRSNMTGLQELSALENSYTDYFAYSWPV